ncbi:MAG: hypothetical protein KatS3mg085_091 [Candidatus Dojkabacteria bacterium]|nr:MAG: hypothetical protein KatS3mg085_091 [Candidatus Dojkabacteria bacterium]
MKQIKQKIIDLAVKLIEIKTNPTNFAELENSLEIVKSELTDYTIEEFESNGYKSLLIHNKSTGHRNFDLILNGHLDVIPAKFEKYQARIEDNKIYGIGSMDMKGNIASMVYAFRDIAHKTNTSVALQIVTDEEVGGFYGTKYQIDQGVRAKFVIAGEATNFDIVNKGQEE